MFTGIVETKGKVIQSLPMEQGRRLVLTLPFESVQEGESIAVNGVCLTQLAGCVANLTFDVSPETLDKTTLGHLQPGDEVNIERAMLAHSRFGGHYVSGHVDTTACLLGKQPVGDYFEIVVGDFACNGELFMLPKGSITLDGVSLTINQVEPGVIKLMLVPHTLAVTTLGQTRVGQRLNVEFDYLTRIVAHQLNKTGQLKNEVI